MNIKDLNRDTIKYKLHHLTKKEKAKIILCLIVWILIMRDMEISLINIFINLILFSLIILIHYNLNEYRNCKELFEEDLVYDYKNYEFKTLFEKSEDMSMDRRIQFLNSEQFTIPSGYILVGFVLIWLIMFLTREYAFNSTVFWMMFISLFYWGYVISRREDVFQHTPDLDDRNKKDWSYDYLIACPHCGYPRNRNKDTHCFKCKQKLRLEKGDKLVKVDFCPKCETIMEKDACPYCGYSATKLITKADIYWVLGIVLIVGFLGLCAYIFPHHFMTRISF